MLNLSEEKKNMTGKSRAMPLSDVEAGKKVYIIAVDSGQGLQGKLAAMGLVQGVRVDVVLNSPGGPFIVAVKGSRIILGRTMAGKIVVV